MSADAAGRRSSSKGGKSRKRSAPPAWWGAGDDPAKQWPGVSLNFKAVWSSARQRWETHGGRYYFDQDLADRACAFFPGLLVHHIGEFAGQPFELLPYQKKLFTRPIFGWRRAANGLRRFRKVFGFVPKGNGKSPWAAGTGLYGARCDGEAAAEVYAVAADKQQARTVHDNAKIMVEHSEDLSLNCEILKDSLSWSDSLSFYKVLSSDAATKHGFRPHMVIFDELHAQKNRNLYEALWRSMSKRAQPLMIIITHAGDDDEGICYEEYEYAKGVLSGSVPDETCLPVIFESTPKEDWTDPAIWAKTNPGLGITVQSDGIAAESLEAQHEPRKQNDFKRYHLNRWVSSAVAWLPIEWWDACDDAMPTAEELAAAPCAVGIDMAQKIDLAALVTAFRLPLKSADSSGTVVEIEVPDEAGGPPTKKRVPLDYRIVAIPTFWLPEDTLRTRVKEDKVPYDIWHKQGLLHLVDAPLITSEPIVRFITGGLGTPALLDRFPRLREAQFAYDPAFASEVAARLRDQHNLTTVEIPQNYTHMSEPSYVLEGLIKARRVVHGGHRLLRWNVENVAVKKDDAGRIRPVKPRKGVKRIDGVVALIQALSRLLVAPEGDEGDASRDFEERGLFT